MSNEFQIMQLVLDFIHDQQKFDLDWIPFNEGIRVFDLS